MSPASASTTAREDTIALCASGPIDTPAPCRATATTWSKVTAPTPTTTAARPVGRASAVVDEAGSAMLTRPLDAVRAERARGAPSTWVRYTGQVTTSGNTDRGNAPTRRPPGDAH